MLMNKILQVSNLTKKYNGKKVVDNLSFDIYEGDIVGLIGPNGSGKSTTMKMIMNLISRDEGDVKMRDDKKFVEHIGFASESSAFYEYLSGYDNLKLIANLYGGISEEKIQGLVAFVGLTENIKKKVKTYSTGMKQRLGLARALLNDPELLILDEPTNGLDPFGMKDIYEMLEKLAKERNVAILISSHLLHDIEKICNKAVMINEGKILFKGEISELKSGLEESYYDYYRPEVRNA